MNFFIRSIFIGQIKKFADICYIFVHGKNASSNRHVQYIYIENTYKLTLIIVYHLCLVTV